MLAAAVPDPDGHFLGGLRRMAGPLREVFGGFGVQVTSETAPGVVELEGQLECRAADLVVIGRSGAAMRACPRRLRETEGIVNHIYRLATGRGWDLMFAVRAMSPEAAAAIVEYGREDGIANDVEWPSVVERAGLTVDYREAGGLSYRTTRDFDAGADDHDGDPAAWITRVEIANLHARALKRLLRQEGS